MGTVQSSATFKIPGFLMDSTAVRPCLQAEHALAIRIAEAALQLAHACQAFPTSDFIHIGCYGRLFVERSRLVTSIAAFQDFLNSKAGD